MSIYRERLIDRMIHLFGYEDPTVISFARICEKATNDLYTNKLLTDWVELFEKEEKKHLTNE